MRPSLLTAYCLALPRLEAEDALRHVAILQAANPALQADYRRHLLRGWEQQVTSSEPQKIDPAVAQTQLALLGIGVRRVQA